MTFARSADLRPAHVPRYNTALYPANRQLLLDLLAVAAADCLHPWLCLLGRSGHRQPDMDRGNMKKLYRELEQASRAGAEREYAMVPGLCPQATTWAGSAQEHDRGYWYEQYCAKPSTSTRNLSVPTFLISGGKRHTRNAARLLPRQLPKEP